MRGDGDVSAVDDLIAVGDELALIDVSGIAGRTIEDGLTGGRVAIRAPDCDCVTESSRTETVVGKGLVVAG